MILEGYIKSKSEKPFVVIGNWQNNEFGKQMHAHFSIQNVQFVGGIYNQELLNDIRYFSTMYFHGHSVGGTNPSLLEAMGSKAVIAANNNAFNKAILEEDAFYFSDSNEVAKLIHAMEKPENYAKSEKMQANNTQKIENIYTWDKIIKDYETLFLSKYAK
jgi:glycosyltransferase involved in cell wall biosynthesis